MSFLTNLFLSAEDRANIDAGNAATEKLRALNAKKHADNPEVFCRGVACVDVGPVVGGEKKVREE